MSTLSCLTIILRLELTVLDSAEQEVTKNDQATASAALRRMLENSVETDCRIKVQFTAFKLMVFINGPLLLNAILIRNSVEL